MTATGSRSWIARGTQPAAETGATSESASGVAPLLGPSVRCPATRHASGTRSVANRMGRRLHAQPERRLPPTEDGRGGSSPLGVRAVVLGVLILAAVGVGVAFDVPTVDGMTAWLDRTGPLGWVAAGLGLALVLTVPAPRSALSLLAGAVAGFWPGLGLVVAGGLTGGLVAFGLSRWLGRGAASRLFGARLYRLDRLIGERGFLPVLTARLLPAPPFAVVSYLAGLSNVRFVPYALATTVGLLPGSLLYVGVGASATGAGSWLVRLGLPLQILVAVVALLTLILVWRLRRRR